MVMEARKAQRTHESQESGVAVRIVQESEVVYWNKEQAERGNIRCFGKAWAVLFGTVMEVGLTNASGETVMGHRRGRKRTSRSVPKVSWTKLKLHNHFTTSKYLDFILNLKLLYFFLTFIYANGMGPDEKKARRCCCRVVSRPYPLGALVFTSQRFKIWELTLESTIFDCVTQGGMDVPERYAGV